MRQEETEVLIVGAGPVGMFTGLLLAREGVKVQIIDQAPEVADQSYACALHGRSLQLFRDAGVGPELIQLGRRIDHLVVTDGSTRRTRINLYDVTPWFPHLLTISQATLETLLEEKLREAGVTVAWHHRLAELHSHNGGGALATIEQLTGTATGYDVPRWETVVRKAIQFSAQFVIGADGCHSVVRRALGIDSEPFSKPQLFVVYEFESDTTATDMEVVLRHDDRNVFWPLPNGRCRWGFEWTDSAPDGEFPPKHRGGIWFEDQEIADRTRHHLQQLLQSRAPWFSGSIGEISWASDVQFEPHLAKQFGRGRCWLVGDAVHQTGPVGVQSMNVGFREAAALTEAIVPILRRRGSSESLDHYSRHFREEWLSLLGVRSHIEASGEGPHLQNGAAILSCLPASAKELDTMLGSLGLQLSTRMSEAMSSSA